MADGITFDMITSGFTREITRRVVAVPRAMRTSLSEAVRAGVAAAQAESPVLTGDLKGSIKADPIKTDGLGLRVAFYPHGGPMFLYSAKEEHRKSYMVAGGVAAGMMLETSGRARLAAAWWSGA